MNYRMESDSIGSKEIPAEAYYGVQSLRAAENFHITGTKLHPEFINSMAAIKKACAITNWKAGKLDQKICDAICQASDEVMAGKFYDSFITDAIQGGAGTSANMNANEVIANRAIEILGGTKGDYSVVHPNDHVNMAQSTNDVIPTAGKLTTIKLMEGVMHQMERLEKALAEKQKEFNDVVKMGRTQLQDAVPVRLGEEFGAFHAFVVRDIRRLNNACQEMHTVNLGGTAIGTSINADPAYVKEVVPALAEITGIPLKQAEDLVDATQNLDGFVVMSSALKTCAVSLSKMSNDLRLLSSGPRTGLGEINLPAKQNGSSIMPGKVNPVIPEVMNQVAFSIIGNDMTICMAAEAGQMELNAFEPVTFYKLFESITALTGALETMVDNCVTGITANRERCKSLVENSVGIITAICPVVGYQKAAQIAKYAMKNNLSVRDVLKSEHLMSDEEVDRILDPSSMV